MLFGAYILTGEKMKDWEIQLLNEGFKRLNKTHDGLRKKKPLIETIEEGDLIFIYNKNRFSSGLNYIGYVDTVVGLCSNSTNYATIPVNFQHGRCKILEFKDQPTFSSDAKPAYQGTIYHSSELYKGKETIENILKTEHKTSLKDIGLE